MSRSASLISLILSFALGACGGSAFRQPSADSYAVESHAFTIDAVTASLPGAAVTKDFFAGTNVQPLVGRFFIDSDFVSVSPATVVLSNRLWSERFGASPTIIGRTIEIDGRRWTVIGIAPSAFDIPAGAQFWMPKTS
jgi:MacB-like protein